MEVSILDYNKPIDFCWHHRLCACFQTRHNRGYSVQQVYTLEHGVCQMCQFDAHQFYENIR